ncbi:replication initiation factor domain-containing protein [Geobacter pelophilus]|uniref:Replication initiation factor domain-containing protein n=1 Tax=Geoanaerobacter pelophilus TaxID=60036 RepID=A0AAW4KYS5_9BACT|nr:replication initiation factor domain-containing protein [Geoanaerobacter pelophilus]MBT0663524.1 replication initiation factor domain-containing protein [Geoanaerobacter pelophilus]
MTPDIPGIKFDWISFTLPAIYNESTLPQLIGNLFATPFELFHLQNRKRNYYKRSFLLSGQNGDKLIEIFCDPDTDKNPNTTLIQISGYALSAYAGNPLSIDVPELFRQVLYLGGKPTVLHIAMDDTANRLPWSEIVELSSPDRYQEQIVSPLIRPRHDGTPQPPICINNETVYFGRRSGRNSICIYRKDRLEQTKFPWLRVEYRTQDRPTAKAIAERIATGDELGPLVSGLVRRFLDFREKSYKTKYNRPSCAWWSEWLGNVDKMIISRDLAPRRKPVAKPKRSKTMEELIRDFDTLMARPTESDFQMLSEFLTRHGITELCKFDQPASEPPAIPIELLPAQEVNFAPDIWFD